jgi:Integrase core domain
LRALAKRYGVNPKTIAKWKARTSVSDLPTGPKAPRSTVLSVEEEAVVIAFRRHTLLPLDDCLYALQPAIPHLTRSSLHRRLQRHGISRLPQVEGEASAKRKFNGQVERMNRTIKDATVKPYFYETHDQLRTHLRDFVDAYNFARPLKTLRGLTHMRSSAKLGLPSRRDSQSARSSKCRDQTTNHFRAVEKRI